MHELKRIRVSQADFRGVCVCVCVRVRSPPNQMKSIAPKQIHFLYSSPPPVRLSSGKQPGPRINGCAAVLITSTISHTEAITVRGIGIRISPVTSVSMETPGE